MSKTVHLRRQDGRIYCIGPLTTERPQPATDEFIGALLLGHACQRCKTRIVRAVVERMRAGQ